MANKDIIGSLAKGLRVIEAFSAEHPRMSISDASDATGLDRATARRCLLTLHQLGYADYDGKFFTLTARVLRLGMGALAAMPLAQSVRDGFALQPATYASLKATFRLSTRFDLDTGECLTAHDRTLKVRRAD